MHSEVKDIKKLLGDPKITFVLGGPASGKGTQCEKLVEEFGYTHISTGDLMRAEMNKGSKEGERIRKIVADGGLVPYELTVQVLVNALIAKPSKNYLIDGFPRAVDQAVYFEQNVCQAQTVLYFNVSKELCLARCMKRAETSGRSDDNEETIIKRFQNYVDATKPVIDMYTKFGKVREIDGSKDINTIYEDTRRAMLPQVSFLMGPKASGKSVLGDQLCVKSNMKKVNFSEFVKKEGLQSKDDETVTMALIKALAQEISPRVLLEDFPKTEKQAKFFMKNCVTPSKVFALSCSLDTCLERMLMIGEGNPGYVPSSILSKCVSYYNKNFKLLEPLFKSCSNFHVINTEQTLTHSFKQMCEIIDPTIINVRSSGSQFSQDLRDEIVGNLSEKHGYINLDVDELIKGENNRRTEIGKEFMQIVAGCKLITAQLIVKMLRNIIYSGIEGRDKFILSNFPENIEQAKEFEKSCAKISAIIYTTGDEPTVEVTSSNMTLFNISSLYQKEFRLKTMKNWDLRTFQEHLGQKVDFGVVIGRPYAGKSTIAKFVASLSKGQVFLMSDVAEEVKKTLGTEEEPFEGDVPISEIEKAILEKVQQNQKTGKRLTYVFDGFTHTKAEDFINFVSELGLPDFVINCRADNKCIEDRYKKRNEVEEVPEDVQEELTKQEADANEHHKAFEQAYAQYGARINFVELQTNNSLETTEGQLSANFAPKVILVNHEKKLPVDTTCSNLAIKYNMIYLSVYQLIRQHIEQDTDMGRKLLASKQVKELELNINVKDEFGESEYSSVHYNLSLVMELIQQTIREKRTNQKYILLEGLCNNRKLLNEDERLELRHMDEMFGIENTIGEVVSVISYTFNLDKDYIEEHEIQYEVFPEPEQPVEPVKKPEGDDEEEEEEQPAADQEDEENKKPVFDPSKCGPWTITNRKPKNLPQLFVSAKGINAHVDNKKAEDYGSTVSEQLTKSLDDFCQKLCEVNDGNSQSYIYLQVLFNEVNVK